MANNSQRISPQDQWLFDGEDNLVGVKNPNVHGQDMLPLLYTVDPVTNAVTANLTITSLQAIIGNITPAAGAFTTLTSTGVSSVTVNSASAALTVTQTGAGNAFVVEDSASTDSTPFVIDSAGNVGIGASTSALIKFYLGGTITGSTSKFATYSDAVFQSDVTAGGSYFTTSAGTAAAAFTLATLFHYNATQATFGAGSTVTSQFGFQAAALTGATNNHGFYSNIAAAANRYNFYANGTAQNYFAGVTGIGVAAAATSNLTVAAGTTAVSSLNIPHGAAPTSPVNGDMWTTTAGLYIRINGSTVGPLS